MAGEEEIECYLLGYSGVAEGEDIGCYPSGYSGVVYSNQQKHGQKLTLALPVGSTYRAVALLLLPVPAAVEM